MKSYVIVRELPKVAGSPAYWQEPSDLTDVQRAEKAISHLADPQLQVALDIVPGTYHLLAVRGNDASIVGTFHVADGHPVNGGLTHDQRRG